MRLAARRWPPNGSWLETEKLRRMPPVVEPTLPMN